MFDVQKSFEDIAEFVKALKEYLSLKNKVLFNGNSDWVSGSKTIPNLHKYRTFLIYPYASLSGVPCEWDGNAIRGAGFVEGVSTSNNTVSLEYDIRVSGDVATINRCRYISHTVGTSHGGDTAWIRRIVGIEPVIPEALKKYLGGGYVNTRRWLCAVSKEVLKRCRGKHKSFKCQNKQLLHTKIFGGEQTKHYIYSNNSDEFTSWEIFITGTDKCADRYRQTSNSEFFQCEKRGNFNKRIWSFNHGSRRRDGVLGAIRCYEKLWKHRFRHLRILFRQHYAKWNYISRKVDIDWGCCHV